MGFVVLCRQRNCLRSAATSWHENSMVRRNLTPIYAGWAILLLTHPDIAIPFIGVYLSRVAWRQLS